MNPVIQAYRERVGLKIRTARRDAGLSHDALAARVGTSRQHLIKLEKGQHLARPDMLAKIAEATGKPVKFLNGDEDDEESHPLTLDDFIELLLDAAAAYRQTKGDSVIASSTRPRRLSG